MPYIVHVCYKSVLSTLLHLPDLKQPFTLCPWNRNQPLQAHHVSVSAPIPASHTQGFSPVPWPRIPTSCLHLVAHGLAPIPLGSFANQPKAIIHVGFSLNFTLNCLVRPSTVFFQQPMVNTAMRVVKPLTGSHVCRQLSVLSGVG